MSIVSISKLRIRLMKLFSFDLIFDLIFYTFCFTYVCV